MIPVSLLLILVAVTLLVLGLTGGSSNLLISSIVASLVAAVALVIGARQSAEARAAEVPDPAAPDLPPVDDPSEVFVAEPEFAAAVDQAARGAGVMDDFPPAGAAFAADSPHSSQRDTVQFDPVDVDERGDLSADERASSSNGGDADDDLSTEPDQAAAATPAEPDYDRAASAIHAARSENPGADAWRRDPAADATVPPGATEPDAASAAPGGPADVPAEADEFAEPDVDDPEDEPLPQSVSPSDAVRVARLDAEVLVVDGRPRYHLPDCRSLVGRLTEPIPVNEAVELGFSPCGLCRPVDRLVGAAAHR